MVGPALWRARAQHSLPGRLLQVESLGRARPATKLAALSAGGAAAGIGPVRRSPGLPRTPQSLG